MRTNDTGFNPAVIAADECAVGIPSERKAFLDGQGLLNQDLLHLVNGLADCEADYMNRSLESEVADKILFRLVSGYDAKLYSYLLDTYGPDAINANLWVYLAQDLSWPFRTVVFKDMPTDMLEEVGGKIWEAYLSSLQTPEACMREVLKQLAQRDDIYGAHSLPPELAFGILCDD